MSTDTPETIEVENIGPVEYCSIPLPPEGGITVLRGANDCGKSISIDATARLAGGKQKLTQRDSQPSAGEARMGDVTLRVGASTRLIGEAEVLSIEGRLAIGDLIEPPIKDAEAADRARTKALCRLTGAEADEKVFFDAVGGQEVFERVVTAGAVDTDDLVEMQRRIKADFDAAARTAEDEAAKAKGEAKAATVAIGSTSLTAECDPTVLQSALQTAIETASSIRTQRQAAGEAAQLAAQASQAAERAMADYSGPTVDDAQKAVEEAQKAATGYSAEEERCRLAVRTARHNTESAVRTLENTEATLAAAVEHAATIAKWQESIDAGVLMAPTEVVEIDAEAATQTAREAVEQGALVREAQVHAKRGTEAKARATANSKRAIELRQAGKDTEKVLAEVVEAEGLTLLNGRWCTERPDCVTTAYYHDRSRGTKAAMAVRLVAKRLRELGEGRALIALPQHIWEGLDGDNRRMLKRVCQELTINLITAEADRGEVGELRAEVYGEEVGEDLVVGE